MTDERCETCHACVVVLRCLWRNISRQAATDHRNAHRNIWSAFFPENDCSTSAVLCLRYVWRAITSIINSLVAMKARAVVKKFGGYLLRSLLRQEARAVPPEWTIPAWGLNTEKVVCCH